MADKLSGIDELRHAVKMFDGNRESFNQQFTAEQLLQLARMQRASGWDTYPDQWEGRQVIEALAGHPPDWNHEDRPIYIKR